MGSLLDCELVSSPHAGLGVDSSGSRAYVDSGSGGSSVCSCILHGVLR